MIITGCSKADKGVEQEPSNSQNKQVEEQQPSETVEELDYVLYLRYRDKPFLFDEAYSIKVSDVRLQGISFEEFIINELIDLKGFNEYINPIPPGTKFLSLQKNGGTVIVNLSKEFSDGQKGNSSDTLLTLASIINSITILPDNEEVQFMIDGKIITELNGIDVSKPFKYIQGLFPDK